MIELFFFLNKQSFTLALYSWQENEMTDAQDLSIKSIVHMIATNVLLAGFATCK